MVPVDLITAEKTWKCRGNCRYYIQAAGVLFSPSQAPFLDNNVCNIYVLTFWKLRTVEWSGARKMNKIDEQVASHKFVLNH